MIYAAVALLGTLSGYALCRWMDDVKRKVRNAGERRPMIIIQSRSGVDRYEVTDQEAVVWANRIAQNRKWQAEHKRIVMQEMEGTVAGKIIGRVSG